MRLCHSTARFRHRPQGIREAIRRKQRRPPPEGNSVKIAVVGAGGIGGYYGALLHQAGHDVTFLARGTHLAAMRERGLRLESVLLAEPLQIRVRCTDRPGEIGAVDLALFAVKAYDTDTAPGLLPPLLDAETAVLTLQNGLDNIEGLSDRIGRRHILGGACNTLASFGS